LRVDPRHADLSAQPRQQSAKNRNTSPPILQKAPVAQLFLQFSYSIIAVAAMAWRIV